MNNNKILVANCKECGSIVAANTEAFDREGMRDDAWDWMARGLYVRWMDHNPDEPVKVYICEHIKLKNELINKRLVELELLP